jgi:hypothetical protein
MDSSKHERSEQAQPAVYEQPRIVDYGTLLELTQANGTVFPSDVPKGHPNTAFPLS